MLKTWLKNLLKRILDWLAPVMPEAYDNDAFARKVYNDNVDHP